MQLDKLFNAPIPGANLTKNQKNYPWRRPPQFPDFDDAFEYFVDDTFSDKEKLGAMFMMADAKMSLVSMIQTLLVASVGNGKITPDMAILLAGPLYKVASKLMDISGVRYLTGFEDAAGIRAFLEEVGDTDFLAAPKAKAVTLTKAQEAEFEAMVEEVKAELPTGGLMGAPGKANDEEVTE